MNGSLDLAEHQTVRVSGLTSADAEALAGSGAATVMPLRDGWQVVTGSKVGVLQAGAVRVWIRPKIAVHRLLFLLLYAADPRGWLDADASLATAEDLPEVMARALIHQTRVALRRGLLRGYVTRDEPSPVLRGRVRAGDQLARRAGMALPLEITYDDYTADIPENQIIAGAVHVLTRGRAISARTSASLRDLDRSFDEVMPWPAARRTPDLEFHRLNAHYEPAVRLARLILEGSTLDAEAGNTSGSAFLFDMNRVFEDFLGAALRASLPPCGPRLLTQHVSRLDQAGRVTLRPDLTWWSDRRTCIAVGDAKYKDLDARYPHNEDLYQLLAYCTAMGLGRGHLIYGASRRDIEPLRVREAGTILEVHALDLTAEPSSLLAQVRRLSGAILGDVPQPG